MTQQPSISTGALTSLKLVGDTNPLEALRMPEALPDDFYPSLVQRIVPFCGNEYDTSDFHSAMEVLNNELNLQLDARDQKVLSLLLTGLAQAYRFGGDPYLDTRLGENSAVHSCHTAILANEIFRRADLFQADQQSPEVVEMRIQITLSCLVHDMGEILGEFNTVPDRAHDSKLKEDPDRERIIFHTALRLAYKAVAEGTPDLFYSKLQEMRQTVSDLVRENKGPEEFREALAGFQVDSLPDEHEEGVQKFLALFDMAELRKDKSHSQETAFRGYAVKAIEHVQGARHLLRFSTKDDCFVPLKLFSPHSVGGNPETVERQEQLSIPFSLIPSARIMSSADYNEGEVGYLFGNAQSDAERRLAAQLRDAVYLTLVEYLNAGNTLIDRTATSLDPEIRETSQDLKRAVHSPELREGALGAMQVLLDRERRDNHDRMREHVLNVKQNGGEYGERILSELMDIETSKRLMSLYKKAVEVDYIPAPGEILMRSEKLPPALTPLKPKNWSAFRD